VVEEEEEELDFDPPDPAPLEAAVEASAKCGKCGGGIRAVLDQFEKTASPNANLDVLFTLFCRDAECGWMDTQWRPWSSKAPEKI
jgi:hypothetical protein